MTLMLKKKIDWSAAKRIRLKGDASARHYYRLELAGQTAILSICENRDQFNRFLKMSEIMQKNGILTPQIWQVNEANLEIVMDDLGETPLATLMSNSNDCQIFEKVTDVLVQFYQAKDRALFKKFDQAYFIEQTQVFCSHPDFMRDIGILCNFINFDQLILTHRDFHAENLMVQNEQIFVIDFQDAGLGPIGYDLISFTHDARRDIPLDGINQICTAYFSRIGVAQIPWDQLQALSLLRQMRIMGVFKRLAEQGKPDYLKHLPRVKRYMYPILQQEQFAFLKGWIDD